MQSPLIEIIVQEKIPDEDIVLHVSPLFTLKDVAELLCYGTSSRGGFWSGWRKHGGTPPLPALMRFSCAGSPELPFDKTLESLDIGHHSQLRYSSRAVRTSVLFSRSWQLLNGQCTYFPTRCGIGNDRVDGDTVRLFAQRLCLAEGCKFPLHDLELVCEKTGQHVKDGEDVKCLFNKGEFLLRVRVQLSCWARRCWYFLIITKGQPSTMLQGSLAQSTEIQLLLFLQRMINTNIDRQIVRFL
eukprot:gnl/MRDRNA2_/MRDRNA2_31531_c0_seq2.p1 gnl/MRDRNA2_/MRDRNA2_31531_c0~~gnl/MRDRNA2_/MRDRNA2_31531_c0_seq2.p1  ORF type:complete len:242 (+),score=16.20 gnl/MRDRNA2_/MRDRNA2_31531_c0_seq2:86-811(+)